MMVMRTTLLLGLLIFSMRSFAVATVSITVDHVEHSAVVAKDIALVVDLHAKNLGLDKQAASVKLTGQLKPNSKQVNPEQAKAGLANREQGWITAKLACDLPENIRHDTWQCDQGLMQSPLMEVPFSMALTPQVDRVDATLLLNKANFSDEVGLHAAEGLTGKLVFSLAKEGDYLRWHNTLNWTGGELFWQPFFLEGGGHQFTSSGVLTDEVVKFDQAVFNIDQVGQLNLKGEMRLADQVITQLEADLPALEMTTAFPLLFKPLLEKSILYDAEMGGNIGFKANIVDAELKSLDIKLTDVDIADANDKFAFYKLNAHIPWDYDEAKAITISYENGQLLNLPLGKTDIQAEVNRFAWTAPTISLPILDGALNLSNISAARIGGLWYWHLGADITPIDMAQLSGALGLPVMQGNVAGKIPMVTYSSGVLTTDGEMVLHLFDGEVKVDHLVLVNPLSISPQLNANMHLRYLDLGQLTNTFSFGSIEGKIDGKVSGLVMHNWQPVAFDAHLVSSQGKYRKKISQRAVENLSALGGAGAVAALQRSFLRFFKAFNYKKIGLRCQLTNNVCLMDGLESTDGGYTIVKGSGIPAITVKGFNHAVAWSELLGRIKRITDENTKAVVN